MGYSIKAKYVSYIFSRQVSKYGVVWPDKVEKMRQKRLAVKIPRREACREGLDPANMVINRKETLLDYQEMKEIRQDLHNYRLEIARELPDADDYIFVKPSTSIKLNTITNTSSSTNSTSSTSTNTNTFHCSLGKQKCSSTLTSIDI